MRLVNSENNRTGRVEIYHPSFGWGTVCGEWSWTDRESSVVCRQLSFTGVYKTRKNAYYGWGSGPILLDIIRCTGDESYIWECSHRGWNQNSCYHSDDVGVDCHWMPGIQRTILDSKFYWFLKVFVWVFHVGWLTQTISTLTKKIIILLS